MESIFENIKDCKFWNGDQERFRGSDECIYWFDLNVKKDSRWLQKKFCFIEGLIIESDLNSKPTRSAELRFKLLQPFIEQAGSDEVYGFRLGKKEFYCKNSKQLDEIIAIVTKYCISDTFEEDFAVIKKIGQGITSTVYLIEDLFTHTQYAAKCINKSYLLSRPSSLSNLINEIEILSTLSHPNIIQLHHIYETSETVNLVLDYLPHGDLHKRLSVQKSFSEEDCARLARNLIETLDYLQSKSIVHRDLKLENIVMTAENNFSFKVIDFGLAAKCKSKLMGRCGTPGYIAPEVIEGKEYDSKADIFSAGVIIYISLTGKHPFNASNTLKILDKNFQCWVDFNRIEKGLAKELVMTMLKKQPRDRMDPEMLLDLNWMRGIRRGSVCNLLLSCSTGAQSVF